MTRDDSEGGTPDWIRTSGLRLRRPPLYPAELRARAGPRSLAPRPARAQDADAAMPEDPFARPPRVGSGVPRWARESRPRTHPSVGRPRAPRRAPACRAPVRRASPRRAAPRPARPVRSRDMGGTSVRAPGPAWAGAGVTHVPGLDPGRAPRSVRSPPPETAPSPPLDPTARSHPAHIPLTSRSHPAPLRLRAPRPNPGYLALFQGLSLP